jgi:hypothetical protein
MNRSTITITFGDAGENHVGMQQLGKKLDRGFTYEELRDVAHVYSQDGDYVTELIDLEALLPEEHRSDRTRGASLLIIRDILPSFELTHEDTFETLRAMKWDSQFWSQKHGRVVNKNARHNFCVGDFSQEADLANKRGTVHDFKDVPCLQKIREDMALMLGDRVGKFIAEGNYYYDSSSCGIGLHGDAERRCVIAFRFGKAMPLCFQWYLQSERVGEKTTLNIRGGDAYIMSDLAVGHDWKLRKVPTLRHAAGCAKYTN